ncbi:MAG: hypothetical protein ABIK09_15500 [Pseudomonadota bacterium]
MKRSAYIIGALLVLLAAPGRAAQITEVQDSFEEGHPFGMSLHVRYQYINDTARILREGPKVKDERYILYNAIDVSRFQHIMHFDLAVGLFHDLELALNLPVILADQTRLDIDTNVLPLEDSSFDGHNRAGLGNVGLGLRWAPWSYTRDKKYPTWLLGLMFRIPTAQVATASNNAVGDGVFRVDVNTSISRRVFWWLEPYFDLHGSLVGSTTKKSPFSDQGVEDVQTLVTPGHSIGLKLGTEFIPWEVESEGRHFSIDMGVGLDYVFEGREYTELFELLGRNAGNCQDTSGCTPFAYSRGPKGLYDKAITQANDRVITGDEFTALKQNLAKDVAAGVYPVTDGITDVEHYGIYSGWLGFHLQPIRYFALGANFSIGYRQPHFITFADPGKDSGADMDGVVTGYNSQKENEYNPVYLEEIDKPGNRMKVDEPVTWSLLFTLTGQF